MIIWRLHHSSLVPGLVWCKGWPQPGLLTEASPCDWASYSLAAGFQEGTSWRQVFQENKWKWHGLFWPRSEAMSLLPHRIGYLRDIGHSRFMQRGIRFYLLMEWWQSFTAEGLFISWTPCEAAENNAYMLEALILTGSVYRYTFEILTRPLSSWKFVGVPP